MRNPVITRVIAIEELPLGSPATRRLIAEWSDGTQAGRAAGRGEPVSGRSRREIRRAFGQ